LQWPQKIQILSNELKKEVNDLYKENYKPLKTKIKKTREDGNISHILGFVDST
jgi:hypothetical protein